MVAKIPLARFDCDFGILEGCYILYAFSRDVGLVLPR